MRDRPLSQVEVERSIADELDRLEGATEEYAHCRQEAAEAEVAYKIAHAHALLGCSGTVGERDAKAAINVEKEYTQRKVSEALMDSSKAAMQSSEARLSALQTLLRSIANQT